MTTRLPKGPALVYITTDGRRIPVDREQITDRRERRLLRSLLAHAGELADKADARDDDPPRHPVGFSV